MLTLGIVSPGAMGSALGRAWSRGGGARVVTTVAGRSPRTRGLAEGLELLPDLARVVGESDIVVSVCPPGAASAVLDDVLAVGGDHGVFADLNAISPAACEALARQCGDAGWEFIDGAISGGPPSEVPARDTRLFLSGARGELLAALPSPGLAARVVGTEPGVASAIKMCTASVYKGTTALWLQALETAYRFGVADLVLADLSGSHPDQAENIGASLAVAASKSERFVAEMEGIAATQQAAGVGAEVFTAMAGVYERLSQTPLAALSPEDAASVRDLQDVLDRLR